MQKTTVIDMSHFSSPDNLWILAGSLPGFVGHGTTCLMDEIRKERDIKVVFKKIDKAHPDVRKILFDQDVKTGKYSLKAEIILPDGRTVSFGNAVIEIEQKEKSNPST